MDATSVIHLAVVGTAAVAAITDARTGRIPNLLTLPSLGLAPLVHLLLAGSGALAESLAAAAVCGLVPYLLFRRQAMGGGDVKLLAGLGAWSGLGLGLEIELATFVIASLAACLKLAWQGQLWRTLLGSLQLARSLLLPRRTWSPSPAGGATMRMGMPIFVACAMALIPRHALWW